ncbi:DUF2076 family protein [Dyella sp. LX-66]|uniref:DUF2076 family protein n=1 Tax=unclassified Dyella TaxID=2634549 RepID=UPI001BDFD275|nr:MULTISPECIES: DUF2076 family protein [unclassified Dyella]MBT2116508.1 DUF2076 family protein [Dyella sp. LX-1]MBT2140549.1 DUF2076 family protein [Dyella sp. LX-66]
MTPQEQQLLDDFLQRLAAAGGVAKDMQADALIQQRLAGHPDALYLLVQRSLLQQQALENAKAQIAQLQAQVSGQGGGSFLGGQAGGWSQPQQPSTPPPMPQQQAAPGWRERLFGGAAPAPQQPAAAPSFLASAATTAAGVAGGMFLFNGIESLLGGHHSGGFFGGGGQETVVENITQNNFYDDNNSGNALQNDHAFAQDNNDFNGDLSDVGDVGFDDSDNDNSWV